jgi:hypothetical protein
MMCYMVISSTGNTALHLAVMLGKKGNFGVYVSLIVSIQFPLVLCRVYQKDHVGVTNVVMCSSELYSTVVICAVHSNYYKDYLWKSCRRATEQWMRCSPRCRSRLGRSPLGRAGCESCALAADTELARVPVLRHGLGWIQLGGASVELGCRWRAGWWCESGGPLRASESKSFFFRRWVVLVK